MPSGEVIGTTPVQPLLPPPLAVADAGRTWLTALVQGVVAASGAVADRGRGVVGARGGALSDVTIVVGVRFSGDAVLCGALSAEDWESSLLISRWLRLTILASNLKLWL